MHGSHHGARRPIDLSEADASAQASSDLLLSSSQLFRPPPPGSSQPVSFSSLPRIVLQLLYGYLSLNEIGVACRMCRDAYQTAAVYRCVVATRPGARERWLHLDGGHIGWAYTDALARSPLRLHVSVFQAVDAHSAWLAHERQIKLIRRFPHVIDVHMHYSPQVPVEWGEQLEKLCTRSEPEPSMEEDDENGTAGADGSSSSSSSSDALPSQAPTYLRTASVLARGATAPTQVQSLMLCPLGWHEMNAAGDMADAPSVEASQEAVRSSAAAAAATASTAASAPAPSSSGLSRFRKAVGAAASKVGSALMGANNERERSGVDESKESSASVGDSASSSSASAASPAAVPIPAVPEPHPDIFPPPHNTSEFNEAEFAQARAKWTRINEDLFSRIGRFTSLRLLGLTLLGDVYTWDVSGFAHLTQLRVLELDLEDPHHHVFGRQMMELIEIVRNVPYKHLTKLQSNALRPLHLRQLMRPLPRNDRDLHSPSAPPVWSTLEEFSVISAPTPPEMAEAVAGWMSEAFDRFWPEADEHAHLSAEGREEVRRQRAQDRADAAAGRPVHVSADEAMQLFSMLPLIRSVDTTSFYPRVTETGLGRLLHMPLIDHLSLGGSPPFHQFFAQDEVGQLAAMQAEADSTLELTQEVVDVLCKLGDGGRVERLALAFVAMPNSAQEASSERKEQSFPMSLQLVLSHFASRLLDLTLESVHGLVDLAPVLVCTNLEVLQLVSLDRVRGRSLLDLAPLEHLWSLRVSHMRVPPSVKRALTPPSALMPNLREFLYDDGYGGGQSQGGGHGHGHGHHVGPPQAFQLQLGAGHILQPALNWLANLLLTHAGQQAEEEDDQPPELQDEEEEEEEEDDDGAEGQFGPGGGPHEQLD